jgi:hypothetical protein
MAWISARGRIHAYEQADGERSNEVSLEHLLIGLLRAHESLATRCRLIIKEVCEELAKAPRECRTATGLVLSDAAKQTILLAAEERETFWPQAHGDRTSAARSQPR